jgi:prefoldin subunit 5
MTPEMIQSLTEVQNALEKLNQTLTAELTEIERDGATPSKIQHLKEGIKAVKDSGNMVLIWADFIARGDMEDPENPDVFRDPNPR